jgi:DNA-binding MarR family transcriptional regulator
MDTSALDQCNCFATRQAARHITKHYERHLSAAHVTNTQFSVLVILNDNPGIAMNELASALVMDRTSLVRVIKPMQRDGWLSTTPDVKDGRKFLLSLTPAGKAKVEEATPLWEKAQQEFEVQVGSGRAGQWRRDFHAMTQSM